MLYGIHFRFVAIFETKCMEYMICKNDLPIIGYITKSRTRVIDEGLIDVSCVAKKCALKLVPHESLKFIAYNVYILTTPRLSILVKVRRRVQYRKYSTRAWSRG